MDKILDCFGTNVGESVKADNFNLVLCASLIHEGEN